MDFVVCTLAVKKKITAGFDMSDRTIPLSDHTALTECMMVNNYLERIWNDKVMAKLNSFKYDFKKPWQIVCPEQI
jgi:hypothetical protein